MALSSITGVTNAEFWNLARKFSPTFASHTAKATRDTFTEKGFEALTAAGLDTINEFFELSLRVAFQLCTTSRAKNPLEATGLLQIYDTPNGGYTQRVAVESIKPISPKFLNLENGSSVDPFVVRKPKSSERFFQQNFEYQSLVTIQDFQVKPIFLSEYGMGQYLSGIMQGLRNGYIIQEYENAMEAINTGINSVTHPLQDTQKITMTTWGDAPSASELMEFIKSVKDVATAMETSAQTGAYNAAGFETTVDMGDLILLTRAGLKTEIELGLEVGAFNVDRLSLPFDIHEVSDFGGLVPSYTTTGEGGAEATAQAYPVYNSLGERTGWATTENAETADLDDDDVFYVDGNADVLAILIQKGAIFENNQNPYVVRPIPNPAGLYTNYWASRPNNSINFDYFYTCVVFTKPAA